MKLGAGPAYFPLPARAGFFFHTPSMSFDPRRDSGMLLSSRISSVFFVSTTFWRICRRVQVKGRKQLRKKSETKTKLTV